MRLHDELPIKIIYKLITFQITFQIGEFLYLHTVHFRNTIIAQHNFSTPALPLYYYIVSQLDQRSPSGLIKYFARQQAAGIFKSGFYHHWLAFGPVNFYILPKAITITTWYRCFKASMSCCLCFSSAIC
jgi:hypothetical protein